MMAQKHLHELLQEDQEPFLLNNYISDRLNQLQKLSLNNTLQLKKHKHKHKPPTTTNVNFCKHACFFSFQNTPDIRNSPLKSPVRSSNDVFLQIPAKTASLLLDAAIKIQNKKTKTKNKNKSFGVFGSFFKKLTQVAQRSRSQTEGDVSVKDILRWDSRNRKSFNKGGTEVCSCEVGFTCSCNGRHSSSAVWSESNEAETSSSGHSHSCDSVEEVEFVMMNTKKQNVADCACFDQHGFFCESPFRFILEKSPSTSGRRTPEFSSPVESPSRHQPEDKQNNGVDGVNKIQSEEDEEEKEQCSPVSVLDTPFEDYQDDDDCHENDDEEDDFDLDCSYANVQRTKQQLLDRLRRFEQLAELDPLELEKRMQEDNDETLFEDDDDEEDCEEKGLREMVCEILCHSSDHERWQEQEVLKRLVYDLIKEELNYSQDMNYVVKRVIKKMELWKEVESNTIDVMIEEDFSREEIGWKKNDEVTKELAKEVEVAILCFLVNEFSEELVC